MTYNHTSQQVQQIKTFIQRGKYDEALILIDEVESIANGKNGLLIEVNILKSNVYRKIGKLEEALILAQEAVKKSKILSKKLLEAKALLEQPRTLTRLGRKDEVLQIIEETEHCFEEMTKEDRKAGEEAEALLLHFKGNEYYQKENLDLALEYYQKSLALNEKVGNKQGISNSLFNIGLIYEDRGEQDRASEYYQKSLVFQEELDNKKEIFWLLNFIGNQYSKKRGELDHALEYHQKSLVLREELDDKRRVAVALNFIGNIYSHKGDLDRALEYYQKSLLLEEERNNRHGTAYCLNKIGFIYYYRGELDRALKILQKALNLREKGGSDLGLSGVLFNLIQVTLAKKEQNLTKQYFSQLEMLQNQIKNKRIHLRYRLAQALLLKNSRRLKQKMKAEEILVKIVEEDVIDYEKTVLAMKHLCELLLVELKMYAEEEVFNEVRLLVSSLQNIGQSQNSFSLLVEALILKAKISLLEGEIKEAMNIFNEAFQITKEKGLNKLMEEVIFEQKTLTAELDKWKELVDSNASIYQRIEQARLESYIKHAQKLSQLEFSKPKQDELTTKD